MWAISFPIYSHSLQMQQYFPITAKVQGHLSVLPQRSASQHFHGTKFSVLARNPLSHSVYPVSSSCFSCGQKTKEVERLISCCEHSLWHPVAKIQSNFESLGICSSSLRGGELYQRFSFYGFIISWLVDKYECQKENLSSWILQDK